MPVSPWKPSAFAFSVERRIIDQDMVSVSLQHPTWPYIAKLDLPADAPVPEATLQRVAHAYLTRANNQKVIDPPIELPEHWLRALEAGDADLMFGWLPIGWPPDALGSDDAPDPMGSYWVNRDEAPVTPEALVTPDKGANKERAAVLLASDRLGDRFYGSGFGIRVVVQVRSDGSDGLEAHITGMTASLPFGIYARGAWGHPWRDQGDANTFLNRLISDDIKRDLETVLGFVEGSVSIRGMRLRWAEGEKPWLVERRGVGIRHGQQLPYAYVVCGTEADVGDVIWVEQHAGRSVGIARIFPIDPASQDKHDGLTRRRPTRTDEQLDAFRANQAIPTSLVLNDSHNRELMRVVPCPRLVREDRSFPADAPKSVNLSSGAPPIRSNDFSAVSAFYNVKQFFDRLDAYGLRPHDHFRVAKLPIKIAYRSAIRPGPGKDGRTVNARVQPENWPIDYPGPTPPGQRPGLEIHLALGDLSHRVRKRWDRTSPSPAVSLGIATDARWIWHEIGHVLLMASVGELEFRFAHSAGDALAAIVSDPHSKLAMDENWRGATFPSVFLTRRHDRSVLSGWSWSGVMHSGMARVPNSQVPRRKGYYSEQILSSTLFRLYRSLGGDTANAGAPNLHARNEASHYTVYLIMRAIQTLGTGGVVPANQPDQLVAALVQADVGTGNWNVKFPRPPSPSPAGAPSPATIDSFFRVGGCAHKVIRWAFEAQGLYAKLGAPTHGPGLPPPVDIYIPDRREPDETIPSGTIAYGPGHYAPVSLDWGTTTVPLWQATEAAIDVEGKSIHVKVGNRGTKRANNVKIRLFLRGWAKGAAAPHWHQGKGWTECSPGSGTPPAGKRVDPNSFKSFEFAIPAGAPTGRYIILAEATCDDDRANTDRATGLPCSRLKTPLINLVAGDNNLGLRVFQPKAKRS